MVNEYTTLSLLLHLTMIYDIIFKSNIYLKDKYARTQKIFFNFISLFC